MRAFFTPGAADLRPAADWPAADWPAADWPAADWPAADWPAADWPGAARPLKAGFFGLIFWDFFGIF